jgi:hypothetical protein
MTSRNTLLATPSLFKHRPIDKPWRFTDIRPMEQFVSTAAYAFACMAMCMCCMYAIVRAGAVRS